MGILTRVQSAVDLLLDGNEITYTVGRRTVIIEPLTGYWREWARLFLIAVILCISERSEKAVTYKSVYSFIKNSWKWDSGKFEKIMSAVPDSCGYDYYLRLKKAAGRCEVTAKLSAYMQVKMIYFDSERREDFERALNGKCG